MQRYGKILVFHFFFITFLFCFLNIFKNSVWSGMEDWGKVFWNHVVRKR